MLYCVKFSEKLDCENWVHEKIFEQKKKWALVIPIWRVSKWGRKMIYIWIWALSFCFPFHFLLFFSHSQHIAFLSFVIIIVFILLLALLVSPSVEVCCASITGNSSLSLTQKVTSHSWHFHTNTTYSSLPTITHLLLHKQE